MAGSQPDLPSYALKVVPASRGGGGLFFLRSQKRDSEQLGRGGGFNERQNAGDLKVEHNSDDELYDEFGRKKKRKKVTAKDKVQNDEKRDVDKEGDADALAGVSQAAQAAVHPQAHLAHQAHQAHQASRAEPPQVPHGPCPPGFPTHDGCGCHGCHGCHGCGWGAWGADAWGGQWGGGWGGCGCGCGGCGRPCGDFAWGAKGSGKWGSEDTWTSWKGAGKG
ncbi:unnamed protein product [Effrenium voratum]|nr:unnamed protein product [Effrenium voratum]